MANHSFKTAFLCLLITSFMACKSEDDNNCSVADGKQIDRISTTYFDVESVETFVYNAKNQLDSILGDAKSPKFYAFKYNDKNQLVERQLLVNYTKKLEKARVDSFEYDAKNRLVKIKDYTTNGSNVLAFSGTTIFMYNGQDKVEKELLILRQDTFATTYEWVNDNISKKTDFDEKGRKLWTFSYQYDNKNNPFLSNRYTYDEVQSRNNVIESSAVDFSGLLDLIANPIKNKYSYNSSNFPTIKTNNASSKMVICYK
jgi:hypothetical protein